jgi:hypothetical protein
MYHKDNEKEKMYQKKGKFFLRRDASRFLTTEEKEIFFTERTEES